MGNIIELVKIFKCCRKQIIRQIEFVVGYTIFRCLMNGEDEIPGVGIAKINKVDGKYILSLDLCPMYQNILNGENVEKILLQELKDRIY